MARIRSLRNFLLVYVLGASILIWAAAGWRSYLGARHGVSERLDAQLAESAKIILALAQHEILELDFESEMDIPEDHFDPHHSIRILYQIWDSDGRLLMRSNENVPRARLTNASSGYVDREIDGRGYRIFSLWDREHKIQVQVAQYAQPRTSFAAHAALNIVVPLLLSIPILALIIAWGISQALRPLRSSAVEVAMMSPTHLEPISTEQAPREVRPLIDAINQLLGRLKTALENERRFTSDAAHELRTPLAALKSQAEVAMNEKDEEARNHALNQLGQAVDGLTHLVGQLLTLARLDPDRATGEQESVDLRDVCSQVIASLAPEALKKGVELGLDEGTAVVRGNPAALGILIRNLIDNAIRYSDPTGEVRVSISEAERANSIGPVLHIQDSGPGISPKERGRVFNRFYRIPGTRADGSGLGLSIVKRVAELHGARIELGDGEPKGLLVKVCFPFSS